jgi:hypothetical protein
LSDPAPKWVGETVNCREHRVKILEWLPHPHEHDIRELPPFASKDLSRATHLILDLTSGQVAGKAKLTRGAEGAADRAPCLA